MTWKMNENLHSNDRMQPETVRESTEFSFSRDKEGNFNENS
jgi:hypothetical protein